MKLFLTCLQSLDRDYDSIDICVKAAVETGNCPIGDLDKLKQLIESKFGKKVVIGTHPW